MNEILKAAELVKNAKEQMNRIKELFKYKTPDEEPAGRERIASRVLFIEVGGPCTHCKFWIATRREHTILLEAITKVLWERETRFEHELDVACETRLGRSK